MDFLEIYGAREHNLKNIDLKIPRDKLVVITGVSGSGKSSLAFDTVYNEGQRRYLESFSAYLRQFLGNLESPDVDKIEGLSPVIAIEQKTTSRNPRSTVGTVTEIYDLLRLMYARAADAFSSAGNRMEKMSDEQVMEAILTRLDGKKINILAPLIRSRKGHYRELFETVAKQGFTKVRVDGVMMDIAKNMQLDRFKIHDIELVVDRAKVGADASRLFESVQTAMKMGEGTVLLIEEESKKAYWYSRNLMDAEAGISYDVPSPNTFSFNSPYGACPECNGLGQVFVINDDALIPDNKLSIQRGAIAPIGEYREIWIFNQLRSLGEKLDFKLTTPWNKLPQNVQTLILEGSKKATDLSAKVIFEGIKGFIYDQYQSSSSEKIKDWAEQFMHITTCPSCQGARLKEESLNFKIGGKNIAELAQMDIQSLSNWILQLDEVMSEKQKQIATEVRKEIEKRISFLLEVGLDYLTLDRPARSLSGGEAQRIRLATQIGSQLMGVLYILDEPSIGLHQRDNERLIRSLKSLRDIGNSVIVVEHDKDMMLESDHVIDFGPGAGVHGGEIVSQGTPAEILLTHSPTADFLSGRRKINIPKVRRPIKEGQILSLKGATGNNLKNVSVDIPLGMMVCITGVSGSGKSTLINETLYPILNKYIYNAKAQPMPYAEILGLEHVTKIIQIDQSPIGRTPRSNAATYTSVFTNIRDLFAQLPESQIRGYKVGRFSFNVKGGRCETCEGAGVQAIEMNFLPTVYVQCEKCQGARYNRETLEVRYKGKSINDVLNMTIEDAVAFFDSFPRIKRIFQTLNEVGLGYIKIGQPATTLSGGEAQRVKIATELSKKDTGSTVYILDEPTTGLHFQDIEKLLEVLQKLVERGNTVIVIEHNLDVIKVADYVIDMGPEGGFRGGIVVAQGTPEEVAQHPTSETARFLRMEL